MRRRPRCSPTACARQASRSGTRGVSGAGVRSALVWPFASTRTRALRAFALTRERRTRTRTAVGRPRPGAEQAVTRPSGHASRRHLAPAASHQSGGWRHATLRYGSSSGARSVSATAAEFPGGRPHAERPHERRTTSRTASARASERRVPRHDEPGVTDCAARGLRLYASLTRDARQRRRATGFAVGDARRERCGCAFSARLAVRVNANARHPGVRVDARAQNVQPHRRRASAPRAPPSTSRALSRRSAARRSWRPIR